MFAVMTHGVFSGPALERLMSSQIEAIVVSNTIPQHEKIAVCPKIQVCGKTLAVFYFFIISFTGTDVRRPLGTVVRKYF